jgi:hypothetical protein
MKNCKFEELIDEYLLNRLSEEKKEGFEEHYFNCPSCFEKMRERNELLRLIKTRGEMIFEDEFQLQEARGASLAERILSFLTPKQWAMTAVSAAVILVIVFGVIFRPNHPTFQIISSETETRSGKSIELLSPMLDINLVPTEFRWAKSDKELEYKFYIFSNGNQLWTTTTKENFVVLPEEVRNLIKPMVKYSWEVKGFIPQGAIVAFSSKVFFRVTKTE